MADRAIATIRIATPFGAAAPLERDSRRAMELLRRMQRDGLLGLQRLVVGGRAVFDEMPRSQCIFFANHTSHLDSTGVLAALPASLRNVTRPVAGADYWQASALRRYISVRLLNAVMIDRARGGPEALLPLSAALDGGQSLIVFPEGTRLQADLPGPFRSGLYHLTKDRPALALIPVYQQNLHRALPKGAPFPLPLLCQSRFGRPIFNDRGEDKNSFLSRARDAVCSLAGH